MTSTQFFVGLPSDSRSTTQSSVDQEDVAERETLLSELESTEKHEETTRNTVPNAPRGRISEIFNGDEVDSNGVTNGSRANGRVRSPRETPTRPRDTHSRLFGQGNGVPPAPLVTDNVRSNIRFGEGETNGFTTPAKSPVLNGSSPNTPTRVSYAPQQRRNPVTGDGIGLPQVRRRWAAARSRGAYSAPPAYDNCDMTLPMHSHTYYTDPVNWPPTKPPYLVYSASKPKPITTIDPYVLMDLYEPPTLYRYQGYDDGPIPDFTPLQTPVTRGPHTLTGFPPIMTKHAPGYLFQSNRDWNDNKDTYFLNYAQAREIEGNPITGDGYKSMNGEINTAVTALNGNYMPINHNRIPPGGYSSGLW